VAAQVVPQILRRVEFRGFGREMDKVTLGRHHQGFGHVPTGLIQYHHRVHVGGKFLGETARGEAFIMSVLISGVIRPVAWPVSGHRRQNIQVVLLVLLDGPGTRADFGPHPRERAVLAKAGPHPGVLDERLSVGAWILASASGILFLKASSTPDRCPDACLWHEVVVAQTVRSA